MQNDTLSHSTYLDACSDVEDDDLPSLDALPDGLDRGEVRVFLLEAVEEVPQLIILVILKGVHEV